LSAKLAYSKHEGMSCDDPWLHICQKRDECDEKIKKMKGVALFFSFLAALEKRTPRTRTTVPLHSALLQTGMEITAKTLPVCKRRGEEESCAPLCTTLKDHNNHFIQTKVDKSFSHSLQLLQDQLIEEPLEARALYASERVVRLQVLVPRLLQNCETS